MYTAAAAGGGGMIQFLQRNRNSNHNDAVQQKVREVLRCGYIDESLDD